MDQAHVRPSVTPAVVFRPRGKTVPSPLSLTRGREVGFECSCLSLLSAPLTTPLCASQILLDQWSQQISPDQCLAGLMLTVSRDRWHTQDQHVRCVNDVLHQISPKRAPLMRGSSAGRAERRRQRWICGSRSSLVRDNVYVSVHRGACHASLK